jgi:uncharacterized protein YbaA (DUF1428 family)
MAYVDGYIIPVRRDGIEAYRVLATSAAQVWLDHGALQVRECVADDVKTGELTSFPQSVKLKDNEVVVFSWIVYESRAKRDEVNENVMKDPRMANMNPDDVPFDVKRMVMGGFETLVALG